MRRSRLLNRAPPTVTSALESPLWIAWAQAVRKSWTCVQVSPGMVVLTLGAPWLTSVAVVVTAPHRKPAFDAALEGINRLKRMVPVWKKEYFADGEVWVDGEWDDSVVRART